MPRMSGARVALEHFGVPDVERRAEQCTAGKQEMVVELIEAGSFNAFPDALRFLLAVKGSGIQVASALSSKNAKLFLRQIRLDTFADDQGLRYGFLRPGLILIDVFDGDVTGRDFPCGKSHPMIFLTAARGAGPGPSGLRGRRRRLLSVQAAKAGRMAALGWRGWTTRRYSRRRARTWW